MPITDSQIRAAQPAEKPFKLFDGDGLYLEVAKSGRKYFRVKYRWAGKERAITLGTYPDVRLTDARGQTAQIRHELFEGRDPANLPRFAARQEAKTAPKEAPKVKHPWRDYARRYILFRQRDGMHYRTAAKLVRQIEATIDVLGDKEITEITAKDILELVRPFEDAGKVETAHEVRSRCAQVFEFAAAEGCPNFNPARTAVGAMVKRRRGRFPGLTDPRDVGRLMRAIRGYQQGEPQVRVGLLLSAYLFPRSAMIRGMRWDEIDWNRALWEIPAERMKGEDGVRAFDHLVPLPSQALRLLKEIRSWTGRGPLVIPSPRGPDKVLSDSTFNAALRSLGYNTREQHCHHGFRITASTNLNELGFNRDWIERQLAHIEGNKVRATYNKAQYLTGRAAMMQAYADWLDEQEEAHV